jgi:predicted aspartyl protease
MNSSYHNLKIKTAIVGCLLFMFTCGKIKAQESTFGQGKIQSKQYYEEIDFELLHDKIVLPVTINNKVYKFLLDTGAPNVISERLIKEINAESIKKIPVTDANNEIDTMQVVSVKSMKLNNLIVENTTALVTDLEGHFILKCYKIDGFIGSNLFKNAIVKISLKQKKIIITDNLKKLNIKSKGMKLILYGEQKSPYIEIMLSGKNGEKGFDHALIDTGMDGFYDMSKRAMAVFLKENIVTDIAKSEGTSNIALFGTAPVTEQTLVSVKSVTINQTAFENTISMSTDDDNSRIGFDLLKHGDLIIDFKNKKCYFEANPTITLNDKIPIYSPTLIDQKFVIGHVWDKSYENELQFGDEIKRIGQYVLSEMDFCDIIQLKNFRNNNESYELEVLSKDNKTKIVKIDNK